MLNKAQGGLYSSLDPSTIRHTVQLFYRSPHRCTCHETPRRMQAFYAIKQQQSARRQNGDTACRYHAVVKEWFTRLVVCRHSGSTNNAYITSKVSPNSQISINYKLILTSSELSSRGALIMTIDTVLWSRKGIENYVLFLSISGGTQTVLVRGGAALQSGTRRIRFPMGGHWNISLT